mgnify:CR=1 FL=1
MACSATRWRPTDTMRRCKGGSSAITAGAPEREWFVMTPGVVFALAMAVTSFTQPGDAVIIQPPVYYPFRMMIEDNGRKMVTSPLLYDGGRYTMDYEGFERELEKTGAKLFILCNPHNPVGRAWTEDELRRIGDICLRHNVVVVADEIHADFARGPRACAVRLARRALRQKRRRLYSAEQDVQPGRAAAVKHLHPEPGSARRVQAHTRSHGLRRAERVRRRGHAGVL